MQKGKKIISKNSDYLVLYYTGSTFLSSRFYIVINSFKSLKEIYISVLQLPKTLNLDNYISAFKELDYLNAI